MTDDPPAPPRSRMTADEAETVWQLAQLSNRPVWEIMRAIKRSPQHAMLFAIAVQLATREWDWLDGETGQWRTDQAKQREKLSRYADLLTEDVLCNGPSPLN